MDEARRASQKVAVLRALEEAGLNNTPVLADLDIGYADPITTLPCGVPAEINCEAAKLRIMESAVVDR
jgi:muramoyltetrapeptide carboxypeptidase LdcA involved in peptidoglycan recycling